MVKSWKREILSANTFKAPGINVACIEKSNNIDSDAKHFKMFKPELLKVVDLLIAAAVTVLSVQMLILWPAQ